MLCTWHHIWMSLISQRPFSLISCYTVICPILAFLTFITSSELGIVSFSSASHTTALVSSSLNPDQGRGNQEQGGGGGIQLFSPAEWALSSLTNFKWEMDVSSTQLPGALRSEPNWGNSEHLFDCPHPSIPNLQTKSTQGNTHRTAHLTVVWACSYSNDWQLCALCPWNYNCYIKRINTKLKPDLYFVHLD